MQDHQMQIQQKNTNKQNSQFKSQWEYVISKNTKDFPMKRFKQSGLLYRGTLFVYGGLTQNKEQFNPKTVYVFNFLNSQWTRLNTVAPNTLVLQTVYGHAALVYSNMMYIFGGINTSENCCNDFYGLNLETYHWKRMQQKGDVVPAPRHSSDLMVYKGHIFLHGGRNQHTIFNDFHFYRIQQKSWYVADIQHFEYLLQNRYKPGICVNNENIYIYGGQYITCQQKYTNYEDDYSQKIQSQPLDDFYKIQINFRNTTLKPEVKILKIVCPVYPGPRSGHSLINLSNGQYLILLGGNNHTEYKSKKGQVYNNEFWVYDTLNYYWVCLKASGVFNISRSLFNCFEYQDQVLIFGGVNSQNQISDEILRLSIQYKPIENYIMKQPIKQICQGCIDAKNKLPMQAQIPIDLLQNAIQKIQFPFSAFGLLIDSVIMEGPPEVKLLVSNSQRQKYIMIKYFPDKAKMLFDNSKDFINAMTMWQGVTYDYQQPQQNHQQRQFKDEKQQKRHKRMLKNNQQEQLFKKRKIFGWNIKVAGLRLGKSICVMQKDQRQIRVAYLTKGKNDQNQDAYLCYYYNLQQSKYLQSQSSQIRKFIDDKNKHAVKQFQTMTKQSTATLIYIQDYHQTLNNKGLMVQELYEEFTKNDIIYGDKQKIEKIANKGYLPYQAVDISLKSYLSHLFIKSQFVLLYGVRQAKLQKINFQTNISKIDKNVRNKNILDITQTVDVQSNIIELYYDPDLTRKPSFFNNGVLIYHQDRLIGRYKYQLGAILDYIDIAEQQQTKKSTNKQKQISGLRNFGNIFGIIQLPNSYPINNLKNAFLMDHYLELLFARLKLVDKIMLKKKKQNKLPLSDAARRLKNKRQGQILNNKNESYSMPTKKIKPN